MLLYTWIYLHAILEASMSLHKANNLEAIQAQQTWPCANLERPTEGDTV